MDIGSALVIFLSAIGAYFAFRQAQLTKQQLRMAREQTVQLDAIPQPRPPRIATLAFVERLDLQGRSLEEVILKALRRNGIICLWGTGGVGKTTLAMQVANRMSGNYDGFLWIGLDRLSPVDFSQVLNMMSILLMRNDSSSLAIGAKKALVKGLIDRGKYLVVIDNFENVETRDKDALLAFLREIQSTNLILSLKYVEGAFNIEIPPMRPEEVREFVRLLTNDPANDNWDKSTYIQKIINTTECNPQLIEWVVGQIKFGAYSPTALYQS